MKIDPTNFWLGLFVLLMIILWLIVSTAVMKYLGNDAREVQLDELD